MLRTVSRRVVLWFACAAAACSAEVEPQEVGGVDLALSAPGGARIDDIQYDLTGPNGFRRSGSFSASGDGITFTYTLPGIPPGPDYIIELTATSSDQRNCRGRSPKFAVVSQQSVTVAIQLSCPGLGNSGTVVVNGQVNTCPIVELATATPSSVELGAEIT